MRRKLAWKDYISIDAGVCHGKPCLRGTRILVTDILELMESGASLREIRSGYPRVTQAHLLAALQFAREAVESGRFVAFRAARQHAVPAR